MLTFHISLCLVAFASALQHFPPLSREGLIGVPRNVRAEPIGNSEAVVQWEPLPGVDGYVIRYTDEPKGASDQNKWQSNITQGDSVDHIVLTNLRYLADYAICVAALKGARIGDCSDTLVVSIKPLYSIEKLQVREISHDSAILDWSYTGLKPVKFYVNYTGTKAYLNQYSEWKNNTFGGMEETTDREGHTLLSLRPDTLYEFRVGVLSGRTNLRHWPKTVKARTLVSVPPFVEPPGAPNPTTATQAKITLKPASEEYGPVSYYWLVIVPANHTHKSPEDFTNDQLLGMKGKIPEQMDAYVTANLSAAKMRELQKKDNGEFVVGRGVDEGGFSNQPLKGDRLYKAFLRAFVQKSAGTDLVDAEMIHTDSIFSPNFTSNKLAKAGIGEKPSNIWLIGPIVAILIITVIIGMLIVWWMKRNKKRNLPTKQGSISKVALGPPGPTETSKLLMPDGYTPGSTLIPGYDPVMSGAINGLGHAHGHVGEPMEMRHLGAYVPLLPQTAGMVAHPPIPITELATHIERLKANDSLLFSQEYESIETGQQFTWEHSNVDVNKVKNRYANVIAYDHSRVVLSVADGMPGSDYINANYIDGYRKPKAYIATQGPLPETFADFWRMVWEENSATIVMLTKLEERTRVKCDLYWPSRGSQIYGHIQVTLLDTFELAHYTIRTLRIQRRGDSEIRDIRHLQFTAWPDHGVPDHPTPFLMFLKRVKSLNPPEAGPIISHCSAGVGRTGAYIVIDCMLDRLRFENTVDIYGCVTCLRSQRNYMVQTEDQYIFIHDAVLDAVQSGSTEVPAGKLYTHMQALVQMQPMDSATGMELEFRHLAALKMPAARYLAANQPCNKQKNRLVNILPYDSTRVCLAPLIGVPEGSDYINASWIDGYRQRSAYVATQGPLPTTVEDFWRMLWEHNSCIIVMLTQLREMGREKCSQYWPNERSERYGSLVVEPITEYHMPQYLLREFKMTDTQTGQSRTIRHFQYTEWPEQGVPKSGEMFIEFIGQVHKTKEQFGADGPITVHCSAGVGRTGIFIALAIVLERMRFENVVDIFTTVKLLRTQRPNMVQSEDQYHFCYQAALEYLGSFDHYAIHACD